MKRALLPLLLLTLTACNKSNDLEGLQTFTYAGGDHRSGSLVYAENPPAGGAHNPLWQNCGVYDQPLYNEYAVHSLEHGAVWITYRPDLDAAGVAQLKTLVEGRSYTLLSPYDGMDTPVAASAWGAQLKVDLNAARPARAATAASGSGVSISVGTGLLPVPLFLRALPYTSR
jgi:hypothetical protein